MDTPSLPVQEPVQSNIEFLYEELRQATDGGSESMTHTDALKQIAYWREQCNLLNPKPSPVAWCLVYEDRRAGLIYSNPTMHFESAETMVRMSDGRIEVVPLYTTPPQKKNT